ncbi:hypothetical protein U1Q18_003440 [Sarracenia purpurea var. burkii]
MNLRENGYYSGFGRTEGNIWRLVEVNRRVLMVMDGGVPEELGRRRRGRLGCGCGGIGSHGWWLLMGVCKAEGRCRRREGEQH